MPAQTPTEELQALQAELMKLRERIASLRAHTPEAVYGHAFESAEGQVVLTQLFGHQSDLIVIHNMGVGCAYCTLWADGLNGLLPHLESRASVALISPDPPGVLRGFALDRGWRFRMVQDASGNFTKAMGYLKDGHHWPGLSAFHKDVDGRILRTGTASFGEGDDFCALWHILPLLKGGANAWEPKFHYSMR